MSNKQWAGASVWFVAILFSICAPPEFARWMVGPLNAAKVDQFMLIMIAAYLGAIVGWLAWLARPQCLRASAKGSPSGN